MTNKYCADLQGGLWLQYNTEKSSWFAKPCCLYNKRFVVNNNINEEYWNASDIVQIRKNNLDNNILPSECSSCIVTEQNGNYSRRQAQNDRRGTSWHRPDSVIEIDIQADFTCNLACNICGPQFSTLWRQVEHDPKIKIEIKKYQVREKLDNILDVVATIPTHNLQHIHFQGGEPLLTLTHLQILEQLGKVVDLSKVSLWYHSNGTTRVSDRVLKFWEKFKIVELHFSLDDIGPRMEYQRWPMVWDEVDKNMLWFKENAPVNVMFNIERTVSPLNAYWVEELESWHSYNFSANRLGDPVAISYHQCFGTYDLLAITHEYRDAILEKLPESHWVYKTIKNIRPDSSVGKINEMLAHLNNYDFNKTHSWKTIYPEFHNWYSRYL